MSAVKVLNAGEKQEVQYCIPLWLRDAYIRKNLVRPEVGRIDGHPIRPGGRVAVVCFGPSLTDTWREIEAFDTVITVSGSHKFLLDQGLTPEGRTWYHVEVDPREHKIALLGTPRQGVTYLPASCCHPLYYDHLQAHGATTKLWHVFDAADESRRILPPGEWAITGGSNVGLRAMTIARFFGYCDQHIFGMDGCEGAEVGQKHAAAHPLQDGSGHALCEYPEGSGQMWRTTSGMLESARQTWHELDMMGDVTATFYGRGLVQEMWKHYTPRPKPNQPAIAIAYPAVISDGYRALNAQLHADNVFYGVGGAKHAEVIKKLKAQCECESVLDYGCGKGMLAKALAYPIWEYDPAIPGKDALPRPADLVVCTDVLEHIEPEHFAAVLQDLARVTRKVGYFVIHTGPAAKTLPDGRNTHLIQRDVHWWRPRLKAVFTVASLQEQGPLLHVVVGPKSRPASKSVAASPVVDQEAFA
jgi:SAM-dependent methyltransferase